MERRLETQRSNQNSFSREMSDVSIKLNAKDHAIERLQLQVSSAIEGVCKFSVWVHELVNLFAEGDNRSSIASLKALQEG